VNNYKIGKSSSIESLTINSSDCEFIIVNKHGYAGCDIFDRIKDCINACSGIKNPGEVFKQYGELFAAISLILPEIEHINAVDKTGKFGPRWHKFCEAYNKISEQKNPGA
jgi:hypothetical protein